MPGRVSVCDAGYCLSLEAARLQAQLWLAGAVVGACGWAQAWVKLCCLRTAWALGRARGAQRPCGTSPSSAACASEDMPWEEPGDILNSPCWVTIMSTVAGSPQMLFSADMKRFAQNGVMSAITSFLFNCI